MRRSVLVAISLAVLAPLAWAQEPPDESLPKFGEYVYVEELPEAVIKVAPDYPEAARRAGVSGSVLVQCLVSREGFVVDTRILKSIPLLDDAAVECLRGWRFKPAASNGRPVAVWVAVPVKFSLDDEPGRKPGIAPAPAPLPAPPSDTHTELSAGLYFFNADSSSRLMITNIDGNRVRLESPGEWEGAGVVHGNTYWGVFVYRDDAREPKNRGARGTHLAMLEPSGRLLVHGTFTNRAWPEFSSTWTPLFRALDPAVRGGPRSLGQVPEPDREAGGSSTPRHPVWPPEQEGQRSRPTEHPVWPPEWSKGDSRIVLAEQGGVDALPEVTRRVEPDPGPGERMAEGSGSFVVVRVQVARDGSVSGAWIAQSAPGLDEAALRAVRRWRFRPAMRAGRSVPAAVYVPVRFAGH